MLRRRHLYLCIEPKIVMEMQVNIKMTDTTMIAVSCLQLRPSSSVVISLNIVAFPLSFRKWYESTLTKYWGCPFIHFYNSKFEQDSANELLDKSMEMLLEYLVMCSNRSMGSVESLFSCRYRLDKFLI